MMKETKEPTLDDQLAAANQAMNDARATRVRADRSAHEAFLKAKKLNRDALAVATRTFDAEIRRIDKARKEAKKAE